MGSAAREGAASNALGWSVELCGGTHVKRTGDIGLISISGESAVASGVRRIEALTGNNARHAVNATIQPLRRCRDENHARRSARACRFVDRRAQEARTRTLRCTQKTGDGRRLGANGSAAASDIRTVGDVKLLARAVQGIEIKDLKSLADQGKKQIGSGVVALVATSEDGKASVVVGVTPDLTSRFSAVDLVRKASEVLGGKGGGGKPDMAQAGGPDGAKAGDALKAIEAAMGA
jgi:alanyl-tRNA synthetase